MTTATKYSPQITAALRMIRAKGALCTLMPKNDGSGYDPLTDVFSSGAITLSLLHQLAGTGSQIFSGPGAVAESCAVAAAGSQTFSGDDAVSESFNLAVAASLDTLVADLIAAGFTVPAYYDTRYNVKTAPSNSAIACAWDDRSARTSVGRITQCNLTSNWVDCGNYTGLDGASKATICARGVAFTFGAARTAVSRYGTAAANRQFICSISQTTAKILLIVQSGGTTYTWTGNDTLAVGTLYDIAWKYDGTQGTDLAKVACRYRSFDAVTQTYSAWTNDTGASVTAGFLAALITATSESLVIGRNRTASGGTAPWYGLIDDIQIHPGVVLSDAQITSAFGMNPLDADWHAPAIWHDFTSMTNRGSTGAANDGTINGDMNLVTDDTLVGRTLLCGAGTASPAWDSVNKVVTFDGVDDFMRAVGGTLKGITQDCFLIVVGVSPQTGQRMATLSVGSTSNVLLLERSTTNLRATTNGVSADTANGTGKRVWMGRRSGTGTVTIGAKNGTAAEVTATGTPGNFVPDTITIGADRSSTPANFGECAISAIIVGKGDFAGASAVVTTWAHTFHGASV